VTDDPASAPQDTAPPADPAAPPARRRFPAVRAAWEWAKSILLAFILFLTVRAFLVEAFKIPSGSMEGTLLVGDFLLVNKMLYGAELPFLGTPLPAVRAPRVGDVVVFQWPGDPEKNFVKRLVAAPGDTIGMRRGLLVRNGHVQYEPYATHLLGTDAVSADFHWQRDHLVPAVDVRRYRPTRNDWGPLVVPAAHYFVLGDNRDNSLDSRYWGFLPDSLVRGSPILVYYSYAPDSGRTFDWLTRVRWARLGDRIR
jgi:signal peptidase I